MRALALVAAIAMVASLFLPWLNPGTSGIRLVPWDMLKELELSADGLRTFATDSPPELLAFLATFALAALFGLLTLIGAPSRLLAFLAGGGALGFLGYGLLQMKDQAAAAGIPVPGTDDLAEFAKSAPEIFGMGAFAWAGGALVLFFAALIGFGDRR
ncbi:MAG: hypothetical protein WAT25_19075 [Paracoccaceae bacterium]